jgi:signal transduction histidine kinase
MFQRFFQWRLLLLLIATSIVAGTLFYTKYLAGKIEREERQRIEEWVQANKVIQQSQESVSISLANLISVNNEDIPLIATDEADHIIDTRNLDSNKLVKDTNFLGKQLEHLKSQNTPILWEISASPSITYKVYYGNSSLLNEVRYYPFVQLLVVTLFVVLILSLITIQNKSNENQVWAGMAKETAHQMGTPLTSLEGWVEMLKEHPANQAFIPDIEKDVSRLKLVSDRFGKIGSTPQVEQTDLIPLIQEMIAYMKRRASGKVIFEFNTIATEMKVLISPTLFNWVLENLIKNALDAMEGAGKISIALEDQPKAVIIDITDTGKGINAANIKKVFNPGFTTKKRGWGLGLSLSKRIMEQYHKGELYVKNSEPAKGTTFRIIIHRK